MTDPEVINDWQQYRLLVLQYLETLQKDFKDLAVQMIEVKIQVAPLQKMDGRLSSLEQLSVRHETLLTNLSTRLDEGEKQSSDIESLKQGLSSLREEIAVIKAKAGLIGGVAGFVISTSVAVILKALHLL
jgi:DNA repair ATPase RecN